MNAVSEKNTYAEHPDDTTTGDILIEDKKLSTQRAIGPSIKSIGNTLFNSSQSNSP